MRFKYRMGVVFLAFLWGFLSIPTEAQSRKILQWEEAVQKEFLEAHLLLYVPEVRAGATDAASRANLQLINDGLFDAMQLVGKHRWALDMVRQRARDLRRDAGEQSNYIVIWLFDLVIRSGRPDVLEIVSEDWKDDPDFETLVARMLVNSTSSPRAHSPQMWYRALESPNPVIREAAKERMAAMAKYPSSYQWAMMIAAIVDRYGHSPTALEMVSDPFFNALREKMPEKVELVRSMVLSYTEKEYLRRQLPPSVVRK